MTNPPPTLTYSLEEILTRLEQKIDKQFTEVNQRLDKVDDRLTKLEIGQAETREKLSGEIRTLDEKIDGIGKRLDNQEFINRGVIVGLIVGLLAGVAKAFGWFPQA
ncbi:MAG: hypothetical protein VKJ46_15065 [Leptolyngbyaceae bacterium]|nr:hypothetical protein [Leptolyngbyaceae bacterium]